LNGLLATAQLYAAAMVSDIFQFDTQLLPPHPSVRRFFVVG
jgi:hypothetical protein